RLLIGHFHLRFPLRGLSRLFQLENGIRRGPPRARICSFQSFCLLSRALQTTSTPGLCCGRLCSLAANGNWDTEVAGSRAGRLKSCRSRGQVGVSGAYRSTRAVECETYIFHCHSTEADPPWNVLRRTDDAWSTADLPVRGAATHPARLSWPYPPPASQA